MTLRYRHLALPGILHIEPTCYRDARGQFAELWRRDEYREAGVIGDFVQDNASVSRRGVVRGLHAQYPVEQGKLVSVLHGAIFDVAVDCRPDSPSFGKWVGVELSGTAASQLWIPPGFLHGFQSLEDGTVVSYKVTGPYDPASEIAVRWNDPGIGISWPVADAELSARDAAAPLLRAVPTNRLPGRPSMNR